MTDRETPVLLKIAAGHEPQAVLRSNLAQHTQGVEIRLELLHQISH